LHIHGRGRAAGVHFHYGPAVDPNGIHDARFVMAILMVGTVVGAYGVNELTSLVTLVRHKWDPSVTFHWPIHPTLFLLP
jgi:hypothetical protein